MTQRIFYIKRYTALRERKAQQIDSVAVTLQADVAGLAVERDSLARTVRGRSDEVRKLGVEEQKFRQIDTSLGSQVRQ
ncbi:hypothetical protein LJB87_02305, partial [Alistipes sp. OttesenSCG-928-L06]|nr:hypothetical protein [Alistipes sp. OttesenSCG-928-L06]